MQRIKRVGICGIYAERLEWFITFTDTRGHGEGEMLVSCSTGY